MPADPLIVVDAANVMGSVPDGWWRDRHGAAVRLRDRLGAAAGTDAGLTGRAGAESDLPAWARQGPLDIVLVVEGQARDVGSSDAVRVVAAPGSGDDTIVDVVRDEAAAGRHCLVVTADRELRRRVTALGAEVRGPSVLMGR